MEDRELFAWWDLAICLIVGGLMSYRFDLFVGLSSGLSLQLLRKWWA